MKRSLVRAALAVAVCVLTLSTSASARSKSWLDLRRGHPAGDWAVMAKAIGVIANSVARTPSGLFYPTLVTLPTALDTTTSPGSGHKNKASHIKRTR